MEGGGGASFTHYAMTSFPSGYGSAKAGLPNMRMHLTNGPAR
jgi:hypothetical protein